MSQITEYSFVEEALNELSAQYKDVPDANTKEGHKACKTGAKAVGKYRIDLEAMRKKIKGPALEKCRAIDDEAKRIQLAIAKIEDPLKIAYKSVDAENKRIEEERIAKILAVIDGMTVFVDMARTGTPETVSEWIEQVEEIDCSDKATFAEFSRDAALERNRVLDALQVELRRVIQQEADDRQRKEQEAELEELRKIKAEQEEKQRKIDDQQREIDHQKELQKQEKQAKIKDDNAEKQRLADVKKAEEAATQRELQRQEDEKEAELNRLARLESNKKHVSMICGQAKKALINIEGINNELAKLIVQAIAKNEITNVTINY